MMGVEDLVIKYAGWIRKRAGTYFKSEWEADDLASETIYKCLKYAKRFDNGRNFKPWASAIMANTFITLYNRRKCVQFTDYGCEERESYIGEEYADGQARLNEILSVIRKCARESVNVDCVILYAKGYSYGEIADNLNIPIGTVRSRVSNGRKILAKALS